MSLKSAFWKDERYMRASWVSMMIIIFSELTGFQAIMLYSNDIFTQIFGDNGPISAREGTFLIAAVNFLASFMSICIVKLLGRRPLLLLGHSGVAICHLFIGFFIMNGYGVGVLIMTCIFMIIY